MISSSKYPRLTSGDSRPSAYYFATVEASTVSGTAEFVRALLDTRAVLAPLTKGP